MYFIDFITREVWHIRRRKYEKLLYNNNTKSCKKKILAQK